MRTFTLTPEDDVFDTATIMLKPGKFPIVFALEGDDTLTIGTEGGEFYGDRGADLFTVNGSNTFVFAGQGKDEISVAGNNNRIEGGSGADFITLGGSGNVARGGGDDDTVNGSSNADSINGEKGNDRLEGDDDNDTIRGGRGDDIISGGDNEGDDNFVVTGTTLTAFNAGDVLTGGRGRDTFVYAATDDDHQVITDFHIGKDQLQISDASAITQVLITDGVEGPGLLIYANGESDDAVFLRGVTTLLTAGSDFILTDLL